MTTLVLFSGYVFCSHARDAWFELRPLQLSDGGEEYGDAFDGENKIEVKEEELDV